MKIKLGHNNRDSHRAGNKNTIMRLTTQKIISHEFERDGIVVSIRKCREKIYYELISLHSNEELIRNPNCAQNSQAFSRALGEDPQPFLR